MKTSLKNLPIFEENMNCRPEECVKLSKPWSSLHSLFANSFYKFLKKHVIIYVHCKIAAAQNFSNNFWHNCKKNYAFSTTDSNFLYFLLQIFAKLSFSKKINWKIYVLCLQIFRRSLGNFSIHVFHYYMSKSLFFLKFFDFTDVFILISLEVHLRHFSSII